MKYTFLKVFFNMYMMYLNCPLCECELELLRLLHAGNNYHRIGTMLGVRSGAVARRVETIIETLCTTSYQRAVAIAVQNHWIDSPVPNP